MIFNDEMTRIEVDLRPYPRMVTNLRHAIKPSLDLCLSPDKNPVPDLEGFQVGKTDATAYPNMVTKLSCESSPNGSTHQLIQLAITIRKSGILFHKSTWRVTFAKMTR